MLSSITEPVVAPVPCVGDEPSGHESRLASLHPSRLGVGPVRRAGGACPSRAGAGRRAG